MDSRTKNVSRNLTVGIIYKISSLVLPFISRTLMIYLVGTTFAGANTLFSSILNFLSMTELGIGSAVVFLMYKPVADDDIPAINALLKYYRKLYRFIGLAVMLIGLAIMPFLPYLINGEKPAGVNLYFLFSLYLINSVISYFFAGYRQSLLNAHQRVDIRDKISIVVTLIVRVGEIVVICFTRNLYLYELVSIVGTVITNILTAYITHRLYPEIKCEGNVPDEARAAVRKRLGGLFGTKLNSIVIHQADAIVISFFLGLTVLTQYGNYYYIFNAVSGIVLVIFASMTASIGNKIVTDSMEEVYKLFKKINFVNNWLVGWCSICLVCLYRPFIIIWVKERLAFPFYMSVLMALYFYIYQIQRTILLFKDAGGLWFEDRYRPYVSMIFNIISNIVLVNLIGISGVVLSTILAFLISVPWCNYTVYKHLLKKPAINNIVYMLKNTAITAVIGVITYLVCSIFPEGIPGIVGQLLVCAILPNTIYYFLFRKKEEFSYMCQLFHRLLRRRKRRIDTKSVL